MRDGLRPPQHGQSHRHTVLAEVALLPVRAVAPPESPSSASGELHLVGVVPCSTAVSEPSPTPRPLTASPDTGSSQLRVQRRAFGFVGWPDVSRQGVRAS